MSPQLNFSCEVIDKTMSSSSSLSTCVPSSPLLLLSSVSCNVISDTNICFTNKELDALQQQRADLSDWLKQKQQQQPQQQQQHADTLNMQQDDIEQNEEDESDMLEEEEEPEQELIKWFMKGERVVFKDISYSCGDWVEVYAANHDIWIAQIKSFHPRTANMTVRWAYTLGHVRRDLESNEYAEDYIQQQLCKVSDDSEDACDDNTLIASTHEDVDQSIYCIQCPTTKHVHLNHVYNYKFSRIDSNDNDSSSSSSSSSSSLSSSSKDEVRAENTNVRSSSSSSSLSIEIEPRSDTDKDNNSNSDEEDNDDDNEYVNRFLIMKTDVIQFLHDAVLVPTAMQPYTLFWEHNLRTWNNSFITTGTDVLTQYNKENILYPYWLTSLRIRELDVREITYAECFLCRRQRKLTHLISFVHHKTQQKVTGKAGPDCSSKFIAYQKVRQLLHDYHLNLTYPSTTQAKRQWLLSKQQLQRLWKQIQLAQRV